MSGRSARNASRPDEPVGHGGDREAVPLQGELGGLADDVVVLDEEDVGLLCHPIRCS